MNSTASKQALKEAKAKYRKKVKTLQLEFYPTTDVDIIKRLDEVAASGEPKATYVKRLIREDMLKKTS